MCNLETEELKFMKRKAETLIEVVVAMAVFGVMMSGLSEFIAEQTRNVARLIDKDRFIYQQQKLVALGQWLIAQDAKENLENVTRDIIAGEKTTYPNLNVAPFSLTTNGTRESKDVEYIEENIVSFDWYEDEKQLIVKWATPDPITNEKTFVSFDLGGG